MKNFYYYLPLLAIAFVSCSDDEPEIPNVPQSQEEMKTFDGDRAMVNVNILTAGNAYGSRASRSDVSESAADDYKYGSADENNVSSIDFYFYDAAGNFVTSYENATITPDYWSDGTDALVEKIGTAKIVLTDLKGQNYPSYVVTVINAPVNFTLNNTSLNDAYGQLLDQTQSWTVNNNVAQNFVMTSSTGPENSGDFHYFATPISEENFAIENGSQGDDWNATPATPVDIYIERLAAKVELKFNSNFTLQADGSYTVPVKMTNDDGTSSDTFTIDGVQKTLYAKVSGWGLNGISKKNYYFKHLSSPFATDGWDYSGTHRCYWAEAPDYDYASYPESFAAVTVKGDLNGEKQITAPDERLTYISFNDIKGNKFTANNFLYLPENTETGAKVWTKNINHAALTEVLLAATIVDQDGNPVELYRLADTYYSKDGLLSYIFNAAGHNIWKKASDYSPENQKFVNMETSDVDITYGFDGTFHIALNSPTSDYYKNNTGSQAWTAADLEKYINSFIPENQSYCYKDGNMYYNVPIRHLRALEADKSAKTGAYGVVRNHWYVVNINSIANLGHSVYRPGEHIIPPSNEPRYMIGSQIKINSWRLVSQDVEL